MSSSNVLTIRVPSWVDEVVQTFPQLHTEAQQLQLTIALAAENVKRGGSPFGAAVFAQGGVLIAAGVNCVLSSGLSIAHAEIVALMNAQHRVAQEPSLPPGPYSLISSAEPCCQCFGALIWAGIDRLVYGASRADVEAIGFDEGPKPERWCEVLRQKGIAVVEEQLRDQALAPLRLYAERGGPIYGSRQKPLP